MSYTDMLSRGEGPEVKRVAAYDRDVKLGPKYSRFHLKNGQYQVGWQPLEASRTCSRCTRFFGMVRWKHHCRACGDLVCDPCSLQRMPIKHFDEERTRVCDRCRKNLLAGKDAVSPGEKAEMYQFPGGNRPSPKSSPAEPVTMAAAAPELSAPPVPAPQVVEEREEERADSPTDAPPAVPPAVPGPEAEGAMEEVPIDAPPPVPAPIVEEKVKVETPVPVAEAPSPPMPALPAEKEAEKVEEKEEKEEEKKEGEKEEEEEEEEEEEKEEKEEKEENKEEKKEEEVPTVATASDSTEQDTAALIEQMVDAVTDESTEGADEAMALVGQMAAAMSTEMAAESATATAATPEEAAESADMSDETPEEA